MTSDRLEDLLAAEGDTHAPEPKHPPGMLPGVRFAGDGSGEAVSVVPPGQAPEWDKLLRDMGLSDVVDVLDVTEVRVWGNPDDLRHYVKAKVRRRSKAAGRADVEALIDEIICAEAPEPAPNLAGPAVMVVCLADWQVGKADGDGLKGLHKRLLELEGLVKWRVAALRAQGYEIGRLVVCTLGDLVEGCRGWYPSQTFGVELDDREQDKFARRWIVRLIRAWSGLFARVTVAAVAGNHGENRGSKADAGGYTTTGDNRDLAVVEQAAEVLQAAEGYEHVDWIVPARGLTVTLECGGARLALAHGHQAKGGGGPQAKLLRWWRDCAHARHPVGWADVLVSGHYHHLQAVQEGSRTWFQCPALDGGSEWWEEQGGATTKAGTLSFLLQDGEWSNLEVLR